MEKHASLIKKVSIYVIIGSIAVIALIISISSGEGSTSSKTATTTSTIATRPKIGEEGYIKTTLKYPFLAVDRESYDQIMKSAVAKDDRGIAEVIAGGGGFFVDNGTKVLVLDQEFGSRKVRVLEGDQINRTGWLVMEWISKEK
ncbi:MAG: hypothetical protein JWN37_775 [Candidatus Nomurabacteria bacterium]|nr:hypothetical protein [Candidatus Nomurabacteria bacterium]